MKDFPISFGTLSTAPSVGANNTRSAIIRPLKKQNHMSAIPVRPSSGASVAAPPAYPGPHLRAKYGGVKPSTSQTPIGSNKP
jgi:hypothetical protein